MKADSSANSATKATRPEMDIMVGMWTFEVAYRPLFNPGIEC